MFSVRCSNLFCDGGRISQLYHQECISSKEISALCFRKFTHIFYFSNAFLVLSGQFPLYSLTYWFRNFRLPVPIHMTYIDTRILFPHELYACRNPFRITESKRPLSLPNLAVASKSNRIKTLCQLFVYISPSESIFQKLGYTSRIHHDYMNKCQVLAHEWILLRFV